MSTTTLTTTPAPSTPVDASTRPARVVRPIPTTRLVGVELRKMFDTRAGFWMMASVGIVSVLATAAVIIWAPDEAITQNTFSTAIGMPLSVVLPIIAIMSITGEYSQRTGLTTYTLVPWRGRVIASKLVATLLVGVVSMLLALAVGALGNLLGSAVTGLDATWDITLAQLGLIVLANILGMLMGFMLGVLFRSTPGAIVGYFVYSFVLPVALGTLAAFQEWFRDLQPWVDVQFAITRLFDNSMTAEYWQQLAVTTLVWLWIPLAVGLRAILRAEVK
ncbi:ABC-type transport system involved in multi-copper enzyme maturation permease subunit [Nocardioides cavernae]|uniref:ABC-type transport system involved in multi-copper enzyme maturation permease subunit n=1 Tax=Nocardioides cavernae TaxID=1921566 RepID=A0A7Y9KSN6_9ACTN|nr:ABC transporter permease [Nocardioides cavernae]NYE35998.1 ABC-type transport system involved in multi-copper enzyme maturation permease subunit [Nocardioides cavernae]